MARQHLLSKLSSAMAEAIPYRDGLPSPSSLGFLEAKSAMARIGPAIQAMKRFGACEWGVVRFPIQEV